MMNSGVRSAVLGFPRMGADRELKKLVEAHWKGSVTESELLSQSAVLRQAHWKLQKQSGVNYIPSNDFSFYDQVLDHSFLFGVIPQRYAAAASQLESSSTAGLNTYFAMARGKQTAQVDLPACEMKKWFDTNYHYIVPELRADQQFKLSATPKPVAEFKEAQQAGVQTRPVLIGPVSYILLGKLVDDENKVPAATHLAHECHHVTKSQEAPIQLVDRLLPAYVELLKQLEAAGAEWIQIDEPCLIKELRDEVRQYYIKTYEAIKAQLGNTKLKLMLTTYFGRVADNFDTVLKLPIQGLHIDVVRDPECLNTLPDKIKGKDLVLSVGIVNGRNVWVNDLEASLQTLEALIQSVGAKRLLVATSCSLLHTPHSLTRETKMDPEIKQWLAFSQEKLAELVILTKALNEGRNSVAAQLAANSKVMQSRRTSAKIHNPEVQRQMQAITPADLNRKSPFAVRNEKQLKLLGLPLFPTTTIGSFPQTAEVRSARARLKAGKLTAEEYDAFIKKETRACLEWQESVGLDILVHGEFERNDMVEYFGEQLEGYVFSNYGWVQSYGSRCVKPPILYGDVYRPKPMTTYWSSFAAQCTKKPVKAMLTGPVTILCWSFVRDDQPRKVTCQQLALSLRHEVIDLEKAGLRVIQVDEPAIREGLPIRRSEWDEYLQWAVDCFRLATSGVQDQTTIETHMCYSDFQDILGAIARLDADSCTIENARSDLKLLQAFQTNKYEQRLGPGLYDIHSPRVPTVEEMYSRAKELLRYLKPEQLQINPDCGLKTRGWDEVKDSLTNLVAVARRLRNDYANIA